MAKETKTKETKATATRKPAASRSRRKISVTREQIELRAYELHLEGFGDEVANWLRAERELATA